MRKPVIVTRGLVKKATPCSGRYCIVAEAILYIGNRQDIYLLSVYPNSTATNKWYARIEAGGSEYFFELPAATGAMAHDFDELTKDRFLEIYAGREIELPADLVEFMEGL